MEQKALQKQLVLTNGSNRANEAAALDELNAEMQVVRYKMERTKGSDLEALSEQYQKIEAQIENLKGPKAPVLLVLHGWGRSRWDSLSRVLPLLPQVSEAWLPDLPAHGEHAARTSWVGVREPEAAAAMLHEIHARRPGLPLALMGHSLGAGVALRGATLAQSRGTPVAGVIALAPYLDVGSPIPGRLTLRELPAWPFAPLALRLLRVCGRMDGPLDADVVGLQAPVLVVACEGDPISPVSDAERVIASLRHGTLLTLPGDRHDEPGAGDPARFTAVTLAFLRGLTPPQGEAA